MKKLVSALLCAGALCACQSTDKGNVTGKIEVDADTLLVYTSPVADRSKMHVDTVVVKDGAFSVQVPDSVLSNVMIYAMKGQMINAADFIAFPLMPAKKAHVTGSMKDFRVNGDKFYEDLNIFNEQGAEWAHKIDSLNDVFMQMYKDKVPADSMRAAQKAVQGFIDDVMGKMYTAKCAYLKQHLNEDIAVYGMFQLPTSMVKDLFDQVGEEAKAGPMAYYYNTMKQGFDAAKARQEAKEKIQPGKPAPDFTLNDLNGKPFTLSSLKGKYVVLDFWGSWCGWCIKGMPAMKESYAKHKAKVEFVGVDCNDTEDKWKAAVKKLELPWIQVRNVETPGVPEMYAVPGYPTKIIIDREGKILKVVVGEDPEFYTFLDKLAK